MEKGDVIAVVTAVAMVAATGALALNEARVEAAGFPFADNMNYEWEPAEPGQGDNVTFEAKSTSPNGDITKWVWDWGDENSPEKGRGEKTYHHFAQPGTYKVTLACADEIGRVEALTKEITVKEITDKERYTTDNIADAGGNMEVEEDKPATFTFKGTPKKEDLPLTYYWDWDDTDGADRANPDKIERDVTAGRIETTHTYEDPGMYIITLWVEDPDGYWDDNTIKVNVLDVTPPTAAMSVSKTDPAMGETVLFDASGSTDNNALASYKWDFGDGAFYEGAVCEHAYGSPGTYTVKLTVVDMHGNEHSAEETIEVKVSSIPIVKISFNVITETKTVQFNATATQDAVPDDNLHYTWNFGDGTDPVAGLGMIEVEHTYANAGKFVVTVVGRNSGGGIDWDSAMVFIKDKAAPSATISASIIPYDNVTALEPAQGPTVQTRVGDVVRFDGSGSNDDQRVVSWNWAFGDGSLGVGAVCDHVFSQVGSFTTTLTVLDASGNEGEATIPVQVIDDLEPLANAGDDHRVDVGQPVTFNASQSTDAGGIASYSWDFDDTNGIAPEATGAVTSYAYPLPGVYIATVTVTDNSGNVDTDTVVTVVRDTVAPTPVISGSDTVYLQPGRAHTFDGSGSADNVGLVTWHWTVTNTNDPADVHYSGGQYLTHTFNNDDPNNQAIYEVKLTVYDTSGNEASTTVTVYVSQYDEDDRAPTIDVDTDPTNVNNVPHGQDIEFDASESEDSQSGIEDFVWTLQENGSGPFYVVGVGDTLTISFSTPGPVTLTLTVTDAAGNSATESWNINVI